MGVAATRPHPLYDIAPRVPLAEIFRNHPCVTSFGPGHERLLAKHLTVEIAKNKSNHSIITYLYQDLSCHTVVYTIFLNKKIIILPEPQFS